MVEAAARELLCRQSSGEWTWSVAPGHAGTRRNMDLLQRQISSMAAEHRDPQELPPLLHVLTFAHPDSLASHVHDFPIFSQERLPVDIQDANGPESLRKGLARI